ncbi:hypothetical protein N7481_007491 [Penicillium waksmanii]|uniref:uncharacterized protein n=1 Tax=Penicillium waksmanii TaxID=69791 RepID=UPI002549B7B2|nr:uncharacterized protein N7481_007491 [Penicillium waksmanii]KAJ5980193.1 hypothetical protein N7481_007491 [Penicillium waksmanii]
MAESGELGLDLAKGLFLAARLRRHCMLLQSVWMYSVVVFDDSASWAASTYSIPGGTTTSRAEEYFESSSIDYFSSLPDY